MVYRCGGTTLDVSIVIVRGGMYKVVCSVHRKQGGDRFTALVSNFLADEFQKYLLFCYYPFITAVTAYF